jgi:hypothetical protein
VAGTLPAVPAGPPRFSTSAQCDGLLRLMPQCSRRGRWCQRCSPRREWTKRRHGQRGVVWPTQSDPHRVEARGPFSGSWIRRTAGGKKSTDGYSSALSVGLSHMTLRTRAEAGNHIVAMKQASRGLPERAWYLWKLIGDTARGAFRKKLTAAPSTRRRVRETANVWQTRSQEKAKPSGSGPAYVRDQQARVAVHVSTHVTRTVLRSSAL